MDIHEAVKRRHSVRKYKNIPLSDEHKNALFKKIDEINKKADFISSLLRMSQRLLTVLSQNTETFQALKIMLR